MCLDAICAHYIMHNVCMQVHHNLAYHARIHRQDHMYLAYCMMHYDTRTSRRDHMNNHMMMYSRDRNRHRT
jgi:hypothetical protein